MLGLLFLFVIGREIAHGPQAPAITITSSPLALEISPMVEIWFAIAALSVTAYRRARWLRLRRGTLHLFVAKTDQERRQVLAAIGPFWDGNEVWLLATGGVLFVAFPRVLASGLSGFYLAIFLVLWTLILRGIGIELRSHIDDAALAHGVGYLLRCRQHAAADPLRRGARAT